MIRLDNTARMLVEVIARLPRARERLEEASPGWPTTSSSAGSSTSSAGAAVDSQPERSWPTLANDPVLADRERLEELAAAVDRDVSALRRLVLRWAEAREGVPGPEDTDAWCRSCKRIGMASPSQRAGLCEWCRRFRYLEGDLPPIDVLEARQQGKRITARMVAEAMGRHRRT